MKRLSSQSQDNLMPPKPTRTATGKSLSNLFPLAGPTLWSSKARILFLCRYTSRRSLDMLRPIEHAMARFELLRRRPRSCDRQLFASSPHLRSPGRNARSAKRFQWPMGTMLRPNSIQLFRRRLPVRPPASTSSRRSCRAYRQCLGRFPS